MNICLIAYRFPILGRATDNSFLWPMARGLAAQGHNVTVIAGKSNLGKSEVVRDGVKAYYLLEGQATHLRFEDAVYNKFVELHRENKFQIVHSVDRSGMQIAAKKKALGVAVAYDIEATQMAQIFSILGMSQESVSSLLQTAAALTYKFLTTYFGGDRALLKTANGIFVTSPQQRIFLERYYHYPDFHTYSVPYGIELSDVPPKTDIVELKKKFGLPENSQVVLTITDMLESFETMHLLSAFEKVAVKKTNTYMLIVGNGPKWKEIEFHLLSLALGNRAVMTGALKTDEISDCITISDVYVNMGSRSTGFEPAMIEAMSQKKVIIGSEMSPMANIIEDGEDGFLLRPADVESLTQLLLDLFSGIVPTSEIGKKAQDKVFNLFDSKKMVEALELAYKKILTNTKLDKPNQEASV